MLEKKDLKKIKDIVKTETDSLRGEFKQDLKAEAGSLRKEFKTEIGSLRQGFKQNLRVEAKSLRQEFKQELGPIKNDLAKIRRDVSMIINFFDREFLSLRARVERIENFLKLPPLSQG